MSLRDTFVRVNRHRSQDRKVAFLGAVAMCVLDQVWAIAADEGEATWADGEPVDVTLPGTALDPRDVLVELPRHADFTLETVQAALAELERSELIRRTDAGIVVPNLGRYNAKRFRERKRKRDERNQTAQATPACPRDRPQVSAGQSSGQSAGRHATGGGGAVAVSVPGAAQEPTTDFPAPGAPAAEPTKKRTRKPKAPPSGPHAEAVAWWCDEFKRRKGVPYAFQGAKDGAHVREMLGWCEDDVAVFRSRATALLTSNDPFYASKGVDLGLLRSCWNRLGSAGKGTGMGPNGDGQQLGRTRPATADEWAGIVVDKNGQWIPPSYD